MTTSDEDRQETQRLEGQRDAEDVMRELRRHLFDLVAATNVRAMTPQESRDLEVALGGLPHTDDVTLEQLSTACRALGLGLVEVLQALTQKSDPLDNRFEPYVNQLWLTLALNYPRESVAMVPCSELDRSEGRDDAFWLEVARRSNTRSEQTRHDLSYPGRVEYIPSKGHFLATPRAA